MLTLYTYQNSRPSDEQVRQLLAGEENYTLLTATKALARERHKLIPPTQHFLDRENKPVRKALFTEVMQAWLKERLPLVSRGEEKVILLRAINAIAGPNPDLAGMLKQDRESWRRVFAGLAARNIDVSQGLPSEWHAKIVNPSLARILVQLKTAMNQHLQHIGKAPFEEAFHRYLDQHFEPSPLILMEGFTFLTELQKAFIDCANDKGARIVFLVPYHAEQSKGFKVIDETYARFGSALERRELETERISSFEDLHYLQQYLFGNPITDPQPPLEQIHLVRYPNRDREIKGCLDQLQDWFSSGTYTPEDVAIVMRHPREFMELIQDYVTMTPLHYVVRDAFGGEIVYPVEIAASPRLLLLTPIGRFILLLYSIWENAQLKLEMDPFETILASGWLGAVLQDTATTFRAVKHQFFSQCATREEWQHALQALREARDVLAEKERLPVRLLDPEIIKQWEKTVELLNSVCSRLFSQGQGTIGSHINALLRELDELLPEDIRQAEKAVLEKIMEVFQDLSRAYSIDLTTEEFGEALHALTRAETEEEEQAEDETDPGERESKGLLRIVTPETIDGLAKPCILYLGTDNQRVPAFYAEPWPFFLDQKNEHLIKERYMFLTVIRSAKEQLILSYAYKDEDRTFQPSTYLSAVEDVLKFPIEKKTVTDSLDLSRVYTLQAQSAPSPVRRKTYTLEELAHYGLCPMRYRLEILHPEARVYRNPWQLEISAQGIWLDRIYQRLLSQELPADQTVRLRRLEQAREQVREEVNTLFPAFTPVNWHSIQHQVDRTLRFHAEFKSDYPLTVIAGHATQIRLMTSDERIVSVHIHTPYQKKIGRFDYRLLDTLLCSEWLLPADGGGDKDKAAGEDENRFSSLKEAVRWWRQSINAFLTDLEGARDNEYLRQLRKHNEEARRRLLSWITAIEENSFPKNPGRHCTECPVRMECLGRVVEVVT